MRGLAGDGERMEGGREGERRKAQPGWGREADRGRGMMTELTAVPVPATHTSSMLSLRRSNSKLSLLTGWARGSL